MNDELTQLYDLANAQCEGALTAEQCARLEELVVGNAELRRHYIIYMQVTACGERHAFDIQHSTPPPVSTAPTLGFLATAYHGTVGFFSQEIPFSLLTATVICGLGLLVGSVTYVTRYAQLAQMGPNSEKRQRSEGPSEKMEYVGLVTGAVDVKWADPEKAPISNYVVLGRTYDLASGLLEITYDTGAKVLLQGPVIYKAESANGGYLSLGKLTGKVEVEKAKGFLVRTPSAVVTDLGTEFGVEVNKGGGTQSVVYSGVVRMVPVGAKDADAREILRAGHSASLAKGSSTIVVTNHPTATRTRFVRDLRKAAVERAINLDPKSIPGLVFWLDAADPNSLAKDNEGNVSLWRDKSGNDNHAQQTDPEKRPTYLSQGWASPVGPKAAVRFNGTPNYMLADNSPTLKNLPQKTVFAVVQFTALDRWQGILSKYSETGWFLRNAYFDFSRLQFGGYDGSDFPGTVINSPPDALSAGTPCIISACHGLRGEFGMLRFNGATQVVGYAGNAINDNLLRIGSESSDRFFHGLLAEVLIYNRQLTWAELIAVEQRLDCKWGRAMASNEKTAANNSSAISRGPNKVAEPSKN